jgi:uncharacterized protein (TIGR02145 family)
MKPLNQMIVFAVLIIFSINCDAQKKSTFTDSRDNHKYKTVEIGKQIWMAENLNFITGDGSWCYNDSTKYCNIFGRLYDYKTSLNVCPAGWHLPSKAEWEVLIDGLGGINEAGGKLKLKGFKYWAKPNFNAENSSGFSALPSGYRTYADFGSNGNGGGWWSITEYDEDRAYSFNVIFESAELLIGENIKEFGYGVRCLKD